MTSDGRGQRKTSETGEGRGLDAPGAHLGNKGDNFQISSLYSFMDLGLNKRLFILFQNEIIKRKRT